MSIQPEGEQLRKAVKWISAERQANPDASVPKLIEQACLAYNLSPKEAAYLAQFIQTDISAS